MLELFIAHLTERTFRLEFLREINFEFDCILFLVIINYSMFLNLTNLLLAKIFTLDENFLRNKQNKEIWWRDEYFIGCRIR